MFQMNEESKNDVANRARNNLLKASMGDRYSYHAIEHNDTLDA